MGWDGRSILNLPVFSSLFFLLHAMSPRTHTHTRADNRGSNLPFWWAVAGRGGAGARARGRAGARGERDVHGWDGRSILNLSKKKKTGGQASALLFYPFFCTPHGPPHTLPPHRVSRAIP